MNIRHMVLKYIHNLLRLTIFTHTCDNITVTKYNCSIRILFLLVFLLQPESNLLSEATAAQDKVYHFGIYSGYGPQFSGLGAVLEWMPLSHQKHNLGILAGAGMLQDFFPLYSATLRYSFGTTDRFIVDLSYAPVYIYTKEIDRNYIDLFYSEYNFEEYAEYSQVLSLGYQRSTSFGLSFFSTLGFYYDHKKIGSSKIDKGLFGSRFNQTVTFGIGWQL